MTRLSRRMTKTRPFWNLLTCCAVSECIWGEKGKNKHEFYITQSDRSFLKPRGHKDISTQTPVSSAKTDENWQPPPPQPNTHVTITTTSTSSFGENKLVFPSDLPIAEYQVHFHNKGQSFIHTRVQQRPTDILCRFSNNQSVTGFFPHNKGPLFIHTSMNWGNRGGERDILCSFP